MNTGTATLTKTKTAEITNISPFGFWLLQNDAEYFVSFSNYPDLLNATISELNSFEVDFSGNLHWENLDVDIEIEALKHPENYPLIYRK